MDDRAASDDASLALDSVKALVELGSELKFKDYAFDPVGAISTTIVGSESDPSNGSISAIGQGTGVSLRDGRTCTLRHLDIRGSVDKVISGSPENANIIRVIVLLDKQTDGAQFKGEDVMTSITFVENAHRNLLFEKRFEILKDTTFLLEPKVGAVDGGSTTTWGIAKTFHWKFDLDIPVEFKSNLTNVSAITNNSLHVMAFSEDNGYFLKYESRVRFNK